MVFISHDIQTVRYISDNIIVMNKGKADERGTAAEVFNNPKDDYTRMLLSAGPSLLLPDLGQYPTTDTYGKRRSKGRRFFMFCPGSYGIVCVHSGFIHKLNAVSRAHSERCER